MTYLDKAAVIDGDYRYLLTRRWGTGTKLKLATFIGLNPSTADAEKDDPTIRRCVNFAKTWGCDVLWMVNLFAYRSTRPKDMLTAEDPIGPDNQRWLLRAYEASDIVIACWGNHGRHLGQDQVVRDLFREKLSILRLNQATGQPAHPLYLPAALKPRPWSP